MNLFKLDMDDKWNISLTVHWVILFIILIIFLFWIIIFLKKNWFFNKNVEIESAEIGIKGQRIKIKPNYTNIDIAYRIWVELNTRKIGFKIDFEHDVISEIYNSWYQFFGVTRELLKSLPAVKIRSDKDSKILIEVTTKILNEGLRPHLTVWQAKYRKWYSTEIERPENKNKTPQQIQIEYAEFELLKSDIIRINKNLMLYKTVIKHLAFGDD
jgi:hypothetical protein